MTAECSINKHDSTSQPKGEDTLHVRPGSLTSATAAGLLWLLVQTGCFRLFAFVAQVALARLLSPEDFGAIALASSVSGVISISVGFGIDDVLLSRANRFRMWIAPAFWASLLLSTLGAAVMIGFAPIAARLYHNPGLSGLLAVSALSMPLSGLSAVTYASLRGNLRFRFIATYGAVEFGAIQILTIVLAWLGCGAYSFVLPLPLAAAVKAGVFWQVAKLTPKWRVRQSQLRALLGTGSAVFGQKLMISLRNNGDYMLLGLFATQASVGLYFVAFRLAAMPVYSLASSLTGVLQPALARLEGQPGRQRMAALKASRLIALVIVPISFLQAAISKPLILLLFGAKWIAAAPLVSILSVGLAFDVVPWVAGALMSAKGEFSKQWQWTAITTPIFFLLISLGYFSRGSEGVAYSVAAYYIVSGPVFSWLALDNRQRVLRDVAGIYLPPIIGATSAVALGYTIPSLIRVQANLPGTIILSCVATLVAYASFVFLLAPVAVRDIVQAIPFRSRATNIKLS